MRVVVVGRLFQQHAGATVVFHRSQSIAIVPAVGRVGSTRDSRLLSAIAFVVVSVVVRAVGGREVVRADRVSRTSSAAVGVEAVGFVRLASVVGSGELIVRVVAIRCDAVLR